jgi:uncharacterized protein YndB with AHSA1/START domain
MHAGWGTPLVMAVTVATVPTPPDSVWAVLADPRSYEEWVVGSDVIRDADPTWPAPGSKIHHRVGVGPIKINDNTEVLESEPARRLALQARTRPLGTARIVIELEPEGPARTRVRMSEEPGDPISRIFHNPLFDKLMEKRNVESLRRLGEMAAQRERSTA